MLRIDSNSVYSFFMEHKQGSYTTWKVMESHGIWFRNLEIYRFNETPGKSWNFILILWSRKRAAEIDELAEKCVKKVEKMEVDLKNSGWALKSCRLGSGQLHRRPTPVNFSTYFCCHLLLILLEMKLWKNRFFFSSPTALLW